MLTPILELMPVKLNEGVMKELTGGDTILARGLYSESESFDPQFNLIVCTNNLFDIESNDDGTSISIADSGPGLSQEDQARIFERFYRADPSRNRAKEEGSGLGLSIVDAAMQAHGGKVSVTSKLGEGATFTVFFPLATS